MSSIPVFPAHWNVGRPVGTAAFDLAAARIEDLFDAWVCAARDVELALAAWALSPAGERGDAHRVYRAATEREERAAVVLAAATAHGD